ncbi:MAG: serine hydrolase domain-containing protein [Bacillota bacterium]
MKRIMLLCLIFTLAMSGLAFAATVDYSQSISAARTEIWQALSNGASSATVAIMDGDRIVYSEAFGMTDRAKSTPANTATQFNIGSTSKIFTAAAILLLCEDGKVDLDQPVTTYLPEFKMADPRYKHITVRMLLNHSSGMPGTNARDGFGSIENPAYVAETLTVLQDSRLKANPGAISVYCNDGFTVAQAVIEKVSGVPYADFLNKRIFVKANLNNTSCFFKNGNKNIAITYSASDGRALPTEYISIMASGGIASTANDLCKFSHELWNGKILNPQSLAEYQKPQYGQQTVLSGKPYYQFGLGWDSIALDEFSVQGVTVLAKEGGTSQFHTQLYTAPKQQLTIALSIAGLADPAKITSAIMQRLLEERGIVKAKSTMPSLPLANVPILKTLLKYAGYYSGGSGAAKIQFDQTTNTMKYSKLHDDEFVESTTLPYNINSVFAIDSTVSIGFAEYNSENYLVTYFNGTPNNIVTMKMLASQQPLYNTTKFNGVLWLQRNLSYYDLMCAGELKTIAVKDLPGYINAGGALCRLTSETAANSDLPYSRDTIELSLFDNGGKPWLKCFAFLYSNSIHTDTLNRSERVTIGADGYNEWRVAGSDCILNCQTPEKSRLIVVTATGDIVYDSLFAGLKPVVVTKGSYVSFIGAPGAQFTLN